MLLLVVSLTYVVAQFVNGHETPSLHVRSAASISTTTTADGAVDVDGGGSMQRALAWLVTQRDANYGWHNDTPRVLLTLQLVQLEDAANVLPTQLEMLLSSKQMEVETVVLLWRHREMPIAPPKLAVFALAMSTLCVDPRQFHGHDLIGTLQHHEMHQDLDFAYATLAACAARAHVRKQQMRRLLEIANAAKDHNIDTVSVTIIALRCIVNDHRHRNLQHAIRKPCISLGRQQLGDGSFGNVYNTAIAMQALHDVPEVATYWNRSAAMRYIESKQDPDGAFTDPALTAEVLLALCSKGLGTIRNLDCGWQDTEIDTHSFLEYGSGQPKAIEANAYNYNDTDGRNITVSYTLWLGTNVSEQLTVLVTAARNTSFYSVMQMAAEADTRFAFEASEWPNGHYVHTLGGRKEEPMGYDYWVLYRLSEMPDAHAPPANKLVAPVGVDDLLIDDGDHYLFWYKKL